MRKLLTGAAVALSAAVPGALAAVGPGAHEVPSRPAPALRAASAAQALPAPQAPPAGPELASLVELKDVQRHLSAFQQIADYNGGNRAVGGQGFAVSVRYVVGRLTKAGFKPKVQRFTFPYWRERSKPVLARVAPSRASYAVGTDFLTFAYSGAGQVTAPVQAVDLPPSGEGTSGCESGDFAGFRKGSIALMQRGTCSFATKVAKAKAAGAAAAVIYNKPGEKGPVNGTVEKVAPIPVVGPSYKVGAELAKAAKKGGLKLRLKTDAVHGKRSASNVIADTRRGRAGNVVVAGAHLDSVPAGPGINDNATGAAALLAVAEKIGKLPARDLRNRVRFAWWGAEEEGLVGSTHYVTSLSAAERGRIALDLNFDMLGSPNGTRAVYDGDHSTHVGTVPPAGSGAIEKVFRDYFAGRRLPVTQTPFDGRSDYGPFVAKGIPSGGIETGAEGVKTAAEAKAYGGRAGKAYDPCYHAKCDRMKNVDLKLLGTNVGGVAYAVQRLAASTLPVNGEARVAAATAVPYRPEWLGPYLVR
ncbi:M28 family peptidase [Actinomadura verrucosospora]|uniref:Aminopeptidase Y n=1 Tax=Actinomadura verrucosospora TaxID=46165 RepID=A0A7D3ZJ13_ACTVE|nr:M28 family peptidase [Actinomadura verrucosospora]QKG25397.1 Aminopeptidase Y [Actinomadura verrucosospora]